ncbi:MAG: hypothetical protein RIT11_954, partial [Pseudomonadota bacterium]
KLYLVLDEFNFFNYLNFLLKVIQNDIRVGY